MLFTKADAKKKDEKDSAFAKVKDAHKKAKKSKPKKK